MVIDNDKRKAFSKSGNALWVVIGNRKGWHKSDWRRVYEDGNGVHYIRLNWEWIDISTMDCREFEISKEGEIS